jgi:hypothetical protein
MAWASNDNLGAAAAGIRAANLAIGMLTAGTPTLDGEADFVSFGAGNGGEFTINWTDAPSSAWIVHYLALGGSDLTNVFIKSLVPPTTSQSVAYTGVGFQADCLIGISNFLSDTLPAQSSDGVFGGIGIATSITAEHVAGHSDKDAGDPTEVRQWLRPTFMHYHEIENGRSLTGDLTAIGSDGFTINWTSDLGVNRQMAVLCLKGGQYKAGLETQKTSNGTKATSGVGFQPKGLFIMGANAVTNASDDATLGKLCIGAASTGVEGCTWYESVDNLATTDTNCSSTTGKVLRHAASPSTTSAEADVTSFDSGGFTLDWTTADATAREFAYLAFGDTAGGGGTPGGQMLLGVG